MKCYMPPSNLHLRIPTNFQIYKGTGLNSDLNLQDAPTAVAPMYIDYESPRQPGQLNFDVPIFNNISTNSFV